LCIELASSLLLIVYIANKVVAKIRWSVQAFTVVFNAVVAAECTNPKVQITSKVDDNSTGSQFQKLPQNNSCEAHQPDSKRDTIK